MFTSFSTALSALNADQVGVDVIGNNLANLSTTGFKASNVSFQEMVAQTLGAAAGNSQVGSGVAPPITTRQFTQGAIQTTGASMDAAIQGNGFFVVRDANSRTLYTRAGNFHLDATGKLLTSTGERVQGWTSRQGVIDPNSAIGDISLPTEALQAPSATTKISLDANLNAAAVVDQPEATFSTPIEVVDSLGATHVLTVTFTKTDANTWDYSVSIPGEDLASGTQGTPSQISGAKGTLTFDGNGKLTSPDAAGGDITIALTGLADQASDMDITWSLYGPGSTPRLTQFSAPSAVSDTSQDGYAPAQVTEVSLVNGGQIIAQYSNGKQEVLGQLAMASIRNPESLASAGNNNLEPTAATGPAVIGVPETGSRGKIMGGALEASNVDIAREFTNLIVMQRSYEASAKVITTTDQLTQATVNLKQ